MGHTGGPPLRRRRPNTLLRLVFAALLARGAASSGPYANDPWGHPPPPGDYVHHRDDNPLRRPWVEDPAAAPADAPPPASSSSSSNAPQDRQATLATRLHGACAFGALGACVGKSVSGSLARPRYVVGGLAACGAMHAVGGRFGELADATGVTAWTFRRRAGALARSRAYPVFPQLKAAVGLSQRRPFPPGAEDPWRYAGAEPEFSMLRCVVGAVVLAGFATSFAPKPPVVPASLVGLLAAAGAVFSVTLRDARGDAARCVVARAVALAIALYASASEARLFSAVAAALRLSGDRLAAFDAKFGVSRRVGAFAGRVAAQAAASSSGAAAPPPPAAAPPSARPGPPSEDDPLAYYASGYGGGPPYQQPYGGNGAGYAPPPSAPAHSSWFQ